MVLLANRYILPSAFEYQRQVASSVAAVKAAGGKSVEGKKTLDRLTKPNLAMFTHAKFSGYYARPGKASGNGAYGVSQISAQGVIDGKGGHGGSGAVFE